MNEKNENALTKNDVEQFSREIIWKRMEKAAFELFKKGYILGRYSNNDPEVRSIEEKISRRVGEAVYFSRGGIEVLHRAKGHRKPRKTLLAKLPEKYHLIKPVTAMFEKAVKALPVNKKRLAKENMAAIDEVRDAIRRNSAGYICFRENTETGEKRWDKLEADDPIFKVMDVLKSQPAHIDGLSGDLIKLIQTYGSDCLDILEYATVTRRFLEIWPDGAGHETHKQWRDALADADFSAYKAPTSMEELEQAMRRQRKRSLRGDARVEVLNGIFGESLVFHWAGSIRNRRINGAVKRGLSVPYLTFSMDRKEMASLLPGGGEVLEETYTRGRVHCVLRADYTLSVHKTSALDLPFFDGIRTAFFKKLVEHGIAPEKFRQLLVDAIHHPLEEQMSKVMQKEKDRSSVESAKDRDIIDNGLSNLGKDFPDETQNWLSSAPGGM